MQDAPPAYRYPLAPLLRLEQWDRDTLALELRRARDAADESERRYRAALADTCAAEDEMRALHRADQLIAVDARRRLHLYLEHAYAQTAARELELRQARQVAERLAAQWNSKRIAVRTLEVHRDRLGQAHDQEQQRRAFRAADELWLTRR